MLVIIHTTLWILLMISVMVGFTRHKSKRIVQSLIYSRIIYFIVIISQFVISVRVWNTNNVMVIFNAILCVATIVMIELGYLQKTTMRMNSFTMIIIIFTIMINVVSQQLML